MLAITNVHHERMHLCLKPCIAQMIRLWFMVYVGKGVVKMKGLSSGIASIGARGAECLLDSKKIGKKMEKSGKREEKLRKRGKIGKERPKPGRFFHFAPPDK